MPRTVTVFHNVAVDPDGRMINFFGYQPGHPLVPVARYVTDSSGGDLELCEDAYRLFNLGDDPTWGQPDARAREYRVRGNRSLSEGDVVVIDGRAYACRAAGFEPIGSDLTIVDRSRPGTASLKGTS